MLRMVNDRADGSLTAGERDDWAWIINAARRARHQPPESAASAPAPTETDPVIEPPNTPLIDAAAAALAASTDRVVILSHAGRRYVAKRVAPQPRSRL